MPKSGHDPNMVKIGNDSKYTLVVDVGDARYEIKRATHCLIPRKHWDAWLDKPRSVLIRRYLTVEDTEEVKSSATMEFSVSEYTRKHKRTRQKLVRLMDDTMQLSDALAAEKDPEVRDAITERIGELVE